MSGTSSIATNSTARGESSASKSEVVEWVRTAHARAHTKHGRTADASARRRRHVRDHVVLLVVALPLRSFDIERLHTHYFSTLRCHIDHLRHLHKHVVVVARCHVSPHSYIAECIVSQ
jgi:hypothetical protein